MTHYLSIALLTGFLSTTGTFAVEPKFEPQTLDDAVEIGYGLAIGDVDGDGKDDILLADKRHFAWYRNPDWSKHIIAKNLTLRDNVCIAAQDIDGDGKVEVAVGAMWNPGETNDKSQSGSVHFLIRPEDPTKLWKPVRLFHDPTTHRMRWVKGGDGHYRLIVLPLHGIGNAKGAGANGVNIRAYLPPAAAQRSDPAAWQHVVLDNSMHVTHNFDGGENRILVAGAEGILLKNVMNTDIDENSLYITPENSEPPTRGAGEVRVSDGLVAAIEPIHGNDLVVYEAWGEKWRRTVLTDQLAQGHALALDNLLGLDSPQVVAGWRNPDANGKVGIRIFYRTFPKPEEWQSAVIDDNTMACEDLKLADLNGDGKLDIIAAGRSTKNLVVYWNRNR